MAAVSATVVSTCLGSAVSLPSTGRSITGFNGLRAVPVLRQRAVISRPLRSRGMKISAVADQETLTKVRGIIAKQLGMDGAKVTPESTFQDLGADSLDTVEIMMHIEDEFNVSLEEENTAKIDTVEQAANLIHEKQNATKANA